MMELPFDLTNINVAEVDNLEATYAALQGKFELDISTPANPKLNSFDSIRRYDNVNAKISYNEGGILRVLTPANECYLVFIKIRHFIKRHRLPDELAFNYRVLGLVRQQKDFGRALIRKETLTDRMMNVIHPVELKFDDDQAFSRNFYTVANDAEKAGKAMDRNFRSALMDIEIGDYFIEANEKEMLIGIDEWLSPENAIKAAEIGCKLAAVR